MDLACFHGKTFWHIYLAGFMSNEKDMLLSKKRKEKERDISSVNL